MSHEEDLYGTIYEPGSVVFRQGEPGETLYLIQSGAVEYSYLQGDTETVLTVLEKGDFFGEMALFGQERRPATAKATRQTRLLPLTRASLLERVRDDPAVALHLLRGLYRRIQHADLQLQQAVESNEVLRLALASHDQERLEPAAGGEKKQISGPVVDAAADVTIGELANLWEVEGEPIWFESGQGIFNRGDQADAMYIILDGAVKIESGSGDNRFVLFRLGPGDYFGETELFIERPRTTWATAVERTQLMPIAREQFLEQIAERPQIALFFLQAMSVRLQNLGAVLANPKTSIDVVRQSWRPLLTKVERVKVAMVSLSTCAGCSAVFLDPDVLTQVGEAAEIVYCPMLIDRDHLVEADVALVDGAVRLREDQEKLEEARAKSRLVVAWGTCASFGGIPAHANQYELEDLIQETYGQARDTYAYYLSGAGGVEQATYQEEGVALLRKAYELDDVVRVDYYVPGCPPVPELLLQLLGELTGQQLAGAKPIVCAECSRRPSKEASASLAAFPTKDEAGTCFHSLGVLCLGLLSKGGCAAICTRNGLPCWGCRGPAQLTLKKMADGDSFEEVVVGRLIKRCQMEEALLKPAVKLLRKQGHSLFGFEQNFMSSLSRIR